MDKQMDLRLERVEKALGTLIESISKYNPSLSQAHDVVQADAELSNGLEECEYHLSPTEPCSASRAPYGVRSASFS